eukprot:gnl/TRDRNA2_/TRDRNA2_177702_c2_seq3.p1 gnl/TRDRNA2_/TRDRNA2_177702_c2~~gnl/TRDRNA2_/TRDRNA2_177702_c2_seq3.p1  ORF type:complete len:656 (-),score=-36.73 gnl/TRDRNA2_/TRDRNA2_177702_c2_seq3:83-2050(-)
MTATFSTSAGLGFPPSPLSPSLANSIQHIIVVDALPLVGLDKLEKLKTILIDKLFSSLGPIQKDGFYMPLEEESGVSKTLGFCFIEFKDIESAQGAVAKFNNHKLDRKHILSVQSLANVISKIPTRIEPLRTDGLLFHEQILDKRANDQFLIVAEKELFIFRNESKECTANIIYKRNNCVETFSSWSPKGKYLVTVHKSGMTFYCDHETEKSCEKLYECFSRLAHEAICYFAFSPHEKYLTVGFDRGKTNSFEKQILLQIFSTYSGEVLYQSSASTKESGSTLNAFCEMLAPKWVDDCKDQYFIQINPKDDKIYLYEAPKMNIISSKSIGPEKLQAFSLSPSTHLIAFSQVDREKLYARITFLRIPDLSVIRQKNLFMTEHVEFFWNHNGQYLIVQAIQSMKAKKKTKFFYLIRFEDKNLPIDVLELPRKHDEVSGLYWDNCGSKFCIVHTDSEDYNTGKYDFSFFDASSIQGDALRCIKTLEKKACNKIYWSPKRCNAVLAGIRPLGGRLEFFNLESYSILRTDEHYNCTDVSWDPTGRFVATISDKTQHVEHGCIIWSLEGIKLCRIPEERLEIFAWRPSPAVLLNPERSNRVASELNYYYSFYDAEAQSLIEATANETFLRRREMLEEFDNWFDQQKKNTIRRKKEILAKYI